MNKNNNWIFIIGILLLLVILNFKINLFSGDFKFGVLSVNLPISMGTQNNIAGLRSTTYGIQQEHPPSWWVGAANLMHSKFPTYNTGFIYGIGGFNSDGNCYINFPKPSGTYSNIVFESTDQNEAYLTAYDTAGYKLWLQVEPGRADVSQLIDLVLTKYGSHSSIIGFGIDVEWLGCSDDNCEGRKVTNAEIVTWLNKVKSYNSNYKIFLKHWDQAYMPTSYPADVVFIDDSENIGSLNSMVSEFKTWGQSFPNNEVGFQVGYPSDKSWWNSLSDPMNNIGTTLFSQIPNMKYFYWVDFSIEDIYTGQSSGCTPNWQCGSWNTCSGNTQTRTCTDSNNCGVTTNKPATSQSCTSCVPNWVTGTWSDCISGTQTRTVTDSNSCGVTTNKPEVSQSCCIAKTCSQLGRTCGTWDNSCGTDITCGSCSSSYTCSGGNCVQQSTCTDTCSSLGFGCGTYSICGVNKNCGSCQANYVCTNGQCVSISDNQNNSTITTLDLNTVLINLDTFQVKLWMVLILAGGIVLILLFRKK